MWSLYSGHPASLWFISETRGVDGRPGGETEVLQWLFYDRFTSDPRMTLWALMVHITAWAVQWSFTPREVRAGALAWLKSCVRQSLEEGVRFPTEQPHLKASWEPVSWVNFFFSLCCWDIAINDDRGYWEYRLSGICLKGSPQACLCFSFWNKVCAE